MRNVVRVLLTFSIFVGQIAFYCTSLQQIRFPCSKCLITEQRNLVRRFSKSLPNQPTVRKEKLTYPRNEQEWETTACSTFQFTNTKQSRRSVLALPVVFCLWSSFSCLELACAASLRSNSSVDTSLANILEAKNTLQKLIDNWELAVIDCTYADIPRDLLESKNKELLLEKASVYALFDKSVSVISCKTTNRIVRDYLGLTGIGPLVALDKSLNTLINVVLRDESMTSDDIESVIQIVEQTKLDLSLADTLSFSARREYNSINNFDPNEKKSVLANSKLFLETKQAIMAAVEKLNLLLNLFSSK